MGAVIGGDIGALGGPANEIPVPGGALTGAEIGLWIADSIGLAGLLVDVVKNLGQFVVYATDAAEIAWYAGDDPRVPVHTDEVTASKLFAAAIAELWMALLTALVFEVMKRAGKLAGKQLSKVDPKAIGQGLQEVSDKIAKSKLGAGTALWFRENFSRIQEAVEKHKEQQRKPKTSEDSGSGQKSDSPDRGIASNRPSKSDSPFSPKHTGRLEPGAVPANENLVNQMQQSRQRRSPVTPEGWPTLPEGDARTFNADPQPVQLSPGTKLYRIVGAENNSAGSFWTDTPPPQTEAQWRGDAAVLDQWNGDGAYTEYTVPENGINAWTGPAAPQPASQNGFVLPGGMNQIWVPPNTVNPGPVQGYPLEQIMEDHSNLTLTQVLTRVISQQSRLISMLDQEALELSLSSSANEQKRDLLWLTTASANIKGYKAELQRAAKEENLDAIAWSALRLTSIYKYFSDDLPRSQARSKILSIVSDIEQLCFQPAFRIASFAGRIGDLKL